MLNELFSTPEREKILIYLSDNQSKIFKVRETSRNLKLSVGVISSFFYLLTKKGILNKKRNEYSINMKSPLTRIIKTLININNFDTKQIKKIPEVKGIGLYGSYANGTNREDSDIDIWVEVKKEVPEEVIAKISSQLSRKTKRRVQIFMIDPNKKGKLRKSDPIFYYSLVYGSILLWGEGLED